MEHLFWSLCQEINYSYISIRQIHIKISPLSVAADSTTSEDSFLPSFPKVMLIHRFVFNHVISIFWFSSLTNSTNINHLCKSQTLDYVVLHSWSCSVCLVSSDVSSLNLGNVLCSPFVLILPPFLTFFSPF